MIIDSCYKQLKNNKNSICAFQFIYEFNFSSLCESIKKISRSTEQLSMSATKISKSTEQLCRSPKQIYRISKQPYRISKQPYRISKQPYRIPKQTYQVSKQSKQLAREDGSIAMEACIALPIFILVLLQLLLFLYAIKSEQALNIALHRVAEEASLVISTEASIEESQQLGKAKAVSFSEPSRFKTMTMPDITQDIAISQLSGPIIERRLAYWYKQLLEQETKPILPKYLRIFVQQSKSETTAKIFLYYNLAGLWENLPRQSAVLVNNWSGNLDVTKDNSNNLPHNDDLADNIWEWDNFSRGQCFANRYGANLPEFHEVVAKSENGKVSMIKSMDLTKNSYKNKGYLEAKLSNNLERLLNFEGSSETGTITQKELLIIIPENSPELLVADIQKFQDRARSQGVTTKIIKEGVSP